MISEMYINENIHLRITLYIKLFAAKSLTLFSGKEFVKNCFFLLLISTQAECLYLTYIDVPEPSL